MSRYPVKTALAIATFGALSLLPEYVPALKDGHFVDWGSFPTALDFVPRKPSVEPLTDELLRLRPDRAEIVPEKLREKGGAAHGGAGRSAGPAIPRDAIFIAGSALDHFYEALFRTERHEPGAVARIAHYGDSPTTADLITADTRALFQKQFGDAGHGFVLIAKPWAWYGHRGVDVSSSGWRIDPATQGARDGIFGFGGVSFRGSAGARSRLSLDGEGQHVVEVAYWAEQAGGTLEVSADHTKVGTLDTRAPQPGPAFSRFTLPADASDVELRVAAGSVRLFGVQIRSQEPGVVYDSLGLNGAYISVLARFFDAGQWAGQLQHYRPDLVIVNYGTNESMYASFVDTTYPKELKEVVRRVRDALPEASILVMSPMDRGQRDSSGEIGTAPVLPRLVSTQQRIAVETGCAFFNTFEAMGGAGTMGRWYHAEPRLVGGDFIHPMPAGARLVGGLLYRALMEGYNRYKLNLMQRHLAGAPGEDAVPKETAATPHGARPASAAEQNGGTAR